MTGKDDSKLPDPRLLLDESLTPTVAQALALVGYPIKTVRQIWQQEGAKDPEIIAWCREHDAVWIHADDRARKVHRIQLQTSGIRTLWIHRPGGAMTGREQLRILSFVLPKLAPKLRERSKARHYKVSAANPTATPSLRPTQV